MTKKLVLTACALAVSGLALAKLPPPDPATKAKAAEVAARAAWQAKIDAYQLCKVQNRIAAKYGGKGGVMRTSAPGAASASGAPSTAVAAAAITAAAPQSSGPASMTAPSGVSPASPSVTPPAAPSTGQAGGTPVGTVAAAPTIPPCTDPGPFAWNPPAQTPLETSGAHSPAGNAATPPSVQPNSAQMAPAQSATPQSKKP